MIIQHRFDGLGHGLQQAPATPPTASPIFTMLRNARADIQAFAASHPYERQVSDQVIAELTQACNVMIGFDKFDCQLDQAFKMWGESQGIAVLATDVAAGLRAAIEKRPDSDLAKQFDDLSASALTAGLRLIGQSRGQPVQLRQMRTQQLQLRMLLRTLASEDMTEIEQIELRDLFADWSTIVIRPVDFAAATLLVARETRDKVLVPIINLGFDEALNKPELLDFPLMRRLAAAATAILEYPSKLLAKIMGDIGDGLAGLGKGVGGGIWGAIKPFVIATAVLAVIAVPSVILLRRYGVIGEIDVSRRRSAKALTGARSKR